LVDLLHEADFIRYEDAGKYTFSLVKERFDAWLGREIDFGEIPGDEQFWVILNAVIDYNKQYWPDRSPEHSDDLFLPCNLDYYQTYVTQVGALELQSVTTKAVETMDREEEIAYLIQHGRNGFLRV
jgi:hypothetical protein